MRPTEDAPPANERSREVVSLRVRVGITGLAAVFLLTLLAASVFGLLGQDDRSVGRLANGTIVNSSAAADNSPKEPLAELGVAPGNAPKAPANGGAAVTVPPSATRPAVVPPPAVPTTQPSAPHHS